MNDFNKPFGVIVAGVGGQGAITVAQLILGACWRSGFYALQSEIHGMSQRGGAVSANIVFDQVPVTSPVVTSGEANLLISMEPLEALRYLPLMAMDAKIISATVPVVNIDNYPELSSIFDNLKKITGVTIVDTDDCAKKLNYKHAGNMCLLGASSKFLPISDEVWKRVIEERFKSKGDQIIEQNWSAFEFGKKLLEK
ncbi:MAG: indolepyruvate oxidoreductase subunit beta [Bacteriovoracaceae bacterium]|nr:indolepyruvate oxidoreductase subunit beta [Bacteriovoracaceae bacterium]